MVYGYNKIIETPTTLFFFSCIRMWPFFNLETETNYLFMTQ